MARKVVLAGACRTAIGVMGGTLSKTPAPDLGTVVIKEALKRTGIKPEQVDEVYMGCVIQAGLGQNPARQAAVNAGIPVEVPATTINVLCGSGMHCVNLAAKLIASGCGYHRSWRYGKYVHGSLSSVQCKIRLQNGRWKDG